MVLIIDPQQSGISGNMIIGALINLGADHKIVKDVMEVYGSHFGEVDVEIVDVNKAGISASFADVRCSDHQATGYTNLLNILKQYRTRKSNKNHFRIC
jgi:uncharacterized protein (DUF111 family)